MDLKTERGVTEAYLRFSPGLQRYGNRFWKDPDIVEEIIQETFLHVWKSRASFRDGADARAWIFGIFFKRQIDYHRQNRYESRRVVCDIDAELTTSVRDDQMNDLPETLPSKWRRAWCLVYLEGYSYSEAAQKLRMKVGTFKSMMHRSFQFARELSDWKTPS